MERFPLGSEPPENIHIKAELNKPAVNEVQATQTEPVPWG